MDRGGSFSSDSSGEALMSIKFNLDKFYIKGNFLFFYIYGNNNIMTTYTIIMIQHIDTIFKDNIVRDNDHNKQ